MAVTMQQRGVVTIPAEIRQRLGWGKGTRLGVAIYKGAVVLMEVTETEMPVNRMWSEWLERFKNGETDNG